jgi:hypothetical protein
MAAASCSPAVASHRAKYFGDFRVQTLLGAQPTSHTKFYLPTQFFLPMAVRDYTQLLQRGGSQSPRSRSQKFRFSLAAISAEPPCSVAAIVVNPEPHTGARPSVRLCVGPMKRITATRTSVLVSLHFLLAFQSALYLFRQRRPPFPASTKR